jgi:predicted DNA-binding ribbon-helix-helix protein
MRQTEIKGGPVKRSVTIAGHPTSISLEPIFWDGLQHAAERMKLPVNAIVAQIDAERISRTNPGNLASAVRVWLYSQIIENVSH